MSDPQTRPTAPLPPPRRPRRHLPQVNPTRAHFTALRSAVDLLTNCVSPDYVEEILLDYRPGGERHELAESLYALIDHYAELEDSEYYRQQDEDNERSYEPD